MILAINFNIAPFSTGNLLKWKEKSASESSESEAPTFAINKEITVETVNEEDVPEDEMEHFSTEVKDMLSEKRKQAYLTRIRTRGYFGEFDVVKNEQTQKLQKIEKQKVAASLLCFDAVREDRAGR